MRCALFVVLHRACDVVSYPRVIVLARLANRLAVLGVLACYLLLIYKRERKNGISDGLVSSHVLRCWGLWC